MRLRFSGSDFYHFFVRLKIHRSSFAELFQYLHNLLEHGENSEQRAEDNSLGSDALIVASPFSPMWSSVTFAILVAILARVKDCKIVRHASGLYADGAR